ERRGPAAEDAARQRARDGQSGARRQRRRLRELAAALSRHGTDRRLLRDDVPRLPGGADVAACLSLAPEPVAARDPPPPRHHLRRPELLLRALPAAHPGSRARGPGPLVMAFRDRKSTRL